MPEKLFVEIQMLWEKTKPSRHDTPIFLEPVEFGQVDDNFVFKLIQGAFYFTFRLLWADQTGNVSSVEVMLV